MNHQLRRMKHPVSLPDRTQAALGAVLLGLAFAASAAQTTTNAPAKSPAPAPAVTNAASALPEIPKSVFIIPSTPHQGKDPFYPNSTRLFASVVFTPRTVIGAIPCRSSAWASNSRTRSRSIQAMTLRFPSALTSCRVLRAFAR